MHRAASYRSATARGPARGRLPRRTRRGAALLLAGCLTVAGYGILAAAPVNGQASMARIRMAHLSNGTAAADVYITSFDGQQKRVLQGLAYGQVSQYLDLAPGAYTATLRPAGASPGSPAMLTASATLSSGGSYTFTVFGPHTSPTPKLLSDPITAPAPGAGRVRVLQASTRAPHVDVAAVGGATLAEDAAFGSVTPYTDVPGGAWTIKASGAGVGTVTKQMQVDPGTVNSLIVFDAADANGIDVESVVDATGMSAVSVAGQSVPAGGIQTGGGGLARPAPNGVPSWWWTFVGGALVVGATATAMVGGDRRRRRRGGAGLAPR